VQELPVIKYCNFPGDEQSKRSTLTGIQNSLERNEQLNRVALLLGFYNRHGRRHRYKDNDNSNSIQAL
jgi:hypothetical protein